jgi:hypothetical protein
MKKLIAIVSLLALTALPVRAETVRTCSSVYGGGEVCGETSATTTTTVEHKVVATGVADNQMVKLIAGLAAAAALATGLYKLTYKSYLLG